MRLTLPSASSPTLQLVSPNISRHVAIAITVVAILVAPCWPSRSVMYSAQQSGADNATINPAALNSPGISHPPLRNLKRSHSPDLYDTPQPGNDGMSGRIKRKEQLGAALLLLRPASCRNPFAILASAVILDFAPCSSLHTSQPHMSC